MCIAGYLSNFSLPEICQLIEKGKQTGLLTLRACLQPQTSSAGVHYIWVYQGRIIAVANRLDHQGLVSLIAQRRWIDERLLTQLVQSCPITQPLGSYLKHKGALQVKHLNWLFKAQVLQSMCTLLQLKDAQFDFNSNVGIPTREMTGLTLLATEATLMGLRAAQLSRRESPKNWDALADKLPEPNGGLLGTTSGYPHYRLNALEWQVWEYTNGTVSLKAIARQLRLPLKQVQQIAFRFIAIGLVKPAPLLCNTASTKGSDTLPAQLLKEAQKRNISYSFLQNLDEFLGSQT